MKPKAPEHDVTSIGNIVAALYGVPLLTIWRLSKKNRPIGQRMVEEGLITHSQLEAALESQKACRAGRPIARKLKRQLVEDIADEAQALQQLSLEKPE